MNEQIRQRILACRTLPTLPAVALKVLEYAQQDEIDVNEIAKTITQDPALAGRILKVVNSSFYGRSHEVATISHAIVILGIQSVKTLVLGFSLVGALARERGPAFDHMKYWRRSIIAATATRLLCGRARFIQTEEAFLATLLADIGVLVLERVFGPAYHAVHQKAASHQALREKELAVFGTTHAEVGGLLATSWKLPPLLVVPVAAHHDPASAGDAALVSLATLVGAGGRCADIFIDAEPAAAIADLRRMLATDLELGDVNFDELMREISIKTQESASLFDISLQGANLDFDAIQKQAADVLVEMTIATQRNVAELRQQNEKLVVQASTDHLTCLANRGRFDEFFNAMFTRSLRGGEPLSLVMIDVDHFKAINDRHGHPAGDAVLRALGALVCNRIRGCDLAARYGGEEFVLVMPGATRGAAATAAESIRHAIAKLRINIGESDVSITASLGVASIEPGSPLRTPEQLLKAVDLAVYKAKHSGRNNVKVFSPPTQNASPKSSAA